MSWNFQGNFTEVTARLLSYSHIVTSSHLFLSFMSQHLICFTGMCDRWNAKAWSTNAWRRWHGRNGRNGRWHGRHVLSMKNWTHSTCWHPDRWHPIFYKMLSLHRHSWQTSLVSYFTIFVLLHLVTFISFSCC